MLYSELRLRNLQKNSKQTNPTVVGKLSKFNIASALSIVQFIRQLLYPVVHKDPGNKFHQEY